MPIPDGEIKKPLPCENGTPLSSSACTVNIADFTCGIICSSDCAIVAKCTEARINNKMTFFIEIFFGIYISKAVFRNLFLIFK